MAVIDGLPGGPEEPPRGPSRAGPGDQGGRSSKGAALVGLGAVLWGTGGVTGAALADAAGWTAPAVATTRLLSGAAFLALVLLIMGALGRSPYGAQRRDGPMGTPARAAGPAVRRVVVVGLLLAAYQAAYFASVVTWGVARATLVALGGAPILIAVARAVRDRHRPDAVTASAVSLGVAGLTLLVLPALLPGGPDPGVGGRDAVARGALLGVAAAVTFAVVTLVNRRPVPGLAPVTMTGAAFAVGGVALLPLALLGPAAGPQAARALADGRVVDGGVVSGGVVSGGAVDVGVVVGLVLLLGAVPTAAAWVAYFSGLPHVPAQRATVLALLEPLTATVAASLLLSEPLGLPAVLGGGLLLAATVLAARPPTRIARATRASGA